MSARVLYAFEDGGYVRVPEAEILAQPCVVAALERMNDDAFRHGMAAQKLVLEAAGGTDYAAACAVRDEIPPLPMPQGNTPTIEQGYALRKAFGLDDAPSDADEDGAWTIFDNSLYASKSPKGGS